MLIWRVNSVTISPNPIKIVLLLILVKRAIIGILPPSRVGIGSKLKTSWYALLAALNPTVSVGAT